MVRRSLGTLLVLALCLAASVRDAEALHVVSDDIPDGKISVPHGGSATLHLDISADDYVQWTWSEAGAQARDLTTRLVWVDMSGREHPGQRLPAGGQVDGGDGGRVLRLGCGEDGAGGQRRGLGHGSTDSTAIQRDKLPYQD